MQKFLMLAGVLVAAVLIAGEPAAAKQQFIEGVFTATESGTPIEMIAWAESVSGILKIGHGFLEDAPVLPRTYRFLVNVGGFGVVGILVVNQDVFTKELDHLEAKMLPFSHVRLTIRTVEVGVPELEDWNKILRLRKDLKATDDRPLVFFLVLDNGAVRRFYPFFIDRQ